MSSPVRSYRLPDGASALDRLTLLVWKAWDAWIRPVLAALVLMGVGFAVGAWLGVQPDRGDAAGWQMLTKWQAGREAAFVAIVDGRGVPVFDRFDWIGSIAVEFVASLVGALAAWPVVRRHRSPVLMGALAGLIITFVHTSSSLLWDLDPLPVAPAVYDAFALAALWSLPVFAALFGLLLRRRRRPGPAADQARPLG